MPILDFPRILSDAQRIAWLRLARGENVGPVTFFRLLDRFGTAEAALDALPHLPAARPLAAAPAGQVEREIALHARLGARLIAWNEPDYPERLRHIADPPPTISVLGNAARLGCRTLAIVGARNASAAGRRLAETLAGDLGRAGFVIASGLARGIDSAAHAGSLATGTVAVLAGGVDNVFPPENRDLYRRIAETGAVVAELPPGTEPKARHFPRRNRIIAGLSIGVVVVEAAWRSGSLLTARMAVDEGRELFAVPGSPLDPRCRGTNDLIRQGATLTESAEDVLAVVGATDAPAPVRLRPVGRPRLAPDRDELSPSLPGVSLPASPSRSGIDPAMASPLDAVLEALGPTPVAVDELVRRCQLSPAVVSAVLLDLELDGRLERHPGQRVSLA